MARKLGSLAKPKTVNPLEGVNNKYVRAALLQQLKYDGQRLLRIWEALLAKAEKGDIAAANLLFDRLDGKVPTPIAGALDEAPLQVHHTIRRVIVRAEDGSPVSHSVKSETGASDEPREPEGHSK